ncbi:hypothetical protein N7474_009730 [Penicillium riverlandense]|uniref:uncharacterized protein n=1 Tax=Penicillium riverlandense TaxID=1903569 RepID=UPI0025466AB5|nr:uncharacterized protein N7474_009730 [Penicillium riverlandense]KAJ5808461.1 hypothetical protein N7474_009730 [Penicillium riverlandense]
MSTVIVFGPTGRVGSVTACTAHEHGAKVFLAMRDTQKPIPGLSAEEEQAGGFERVQADLTDPDSVAAAVQKSGARRAFIYLAFGTPDHMRSTLRALKSSGIQFVVFLSSYTISGELADIPPSELIAYVHAQVEISLDEVFGQENYVAMRPGGFATNTLKFKAAINAGEVKLFAPDFKFDLITPIDMGRVSGTILVQGPRNNQRKVYLYGPKILTQQESIGVIAKVLGKEVKFSKITAQEELDGHIQAGTPRPVAEYIVRVTGDPEPAAGRRANYEEGVENVKLYTGKPSTGFEEWVEANKELYSV